MVGVRAPLSWRRWLFGGTAHLQDADHLQTACSHRSSYFDLFEYTLHMELWKFGGNFPNTIVSQHEITFVDLAQVPRLPASAPGSLLVLAYSYPNRLAHAIE